MTSARGVELVPVGDILAILGADDYAELRLKGGRSPAACGQAGATDQPVTASFMRVHRSAIANLAQVERLGATAAAGVWG